MNPEEAVRAHLDVTDSGSGMLVPVHWGTFRLAPIRGASRSSGYSRRLNPSTSR